MSGSQDVCALLDHPNIGGPIGICACGEYGYAMVVSAGKMPFQLKFRYGDVAEATDASA